MTSNILEWVPQNWPTIKTIYPLILEWFVSIQKCTINLSCCKVAILTDTCLFGIVLCFYLGFLLIRNNYVKSWKKKNCLNPLCVPCVSIIHPSYFERGMNVPNLGFFSHWNDFPRKWRDRVAKVGLVSNILNAGFRFESGVLYYRDIYNLIKTGLNLRRE